MSDEQLQLGVQDVPVSQIRESRKALREAQRDTEAYEELVGSIRSDGLLNPIVLRHSVDPETGETFFELVDGVQRYNAALDCGMEMIPANVIKNENEASLLRKQLIGNIHRIETKPVEYSRHLQKILALDPLLTITQLADQLNKSGAWISQRLNLLSLEKRISELVDEGRINLTNAYALARLPVEEQVNWVDQAMTETPGEFCPKVHERKKELDKARREGRAAAEAVFTPIARLQKMADIKAELEKPSVVGTLLKQTGTDDLAEAFLLGVKWCVKLDPLSVAEGQRAWEAKQKALSEKKEAAKAERLEKRQKEAEVKAARIKLETELYHQGKSEEDIKAALEAFDKEQKEKDK